MTNVAHGGLRADEKIRQHRIIRVFSAILAESNACAPRGIRVQRYFSKLLERG